MRELRGSSSQREMADAIGIKYNAWARYEAGDVLPGADIISRICRTHSCSADWLLGLPERGGSSTTVTGNTGIIGAVGTNARATVSVGGRGATRHPDCASCKFKRLADAFKAL